MVKAKIWYFKNQFDGQPKKSDFELKEQELPPLKSGEVLVENEFLSVDPYMRVYKKEPGTPMIGSSVGRITATENKRFKVGDKVVVNGGWRTHSIVSEAGTMALNPVPALGDLPLSASLGILGMPGMTAYFGFIDLCKPKVGETVLVNGAAGAVGSVVGQLAKIKQCRVIGCAGTAAKVEWLKKLGFDYVFNYKEKTVKEALDEAAPKGIDVYFDNVGGDFTVDALQYLNNHARILVCGGISTYHDKERKKIPDPFMTILSKKLTVFGFIVTDVIQRWPEAFPEMLLWLQQGKLQFRETITQGFENMPEAFFSLFTGGNTGKAVVKV